MTHRYFLMSAFLCFLLQTDAYAQSSDLKDAESTSFRTCRIALVVAKNAPKRTELPAEMLSTMQRQIEFIMAENAFHSPPGSVEDGLKRIRESEAWFLAFSREIASALKTFDEPGKLDEILQACHQPIWRQVEIIIEKLIAYRNTALTNAMPQEKANQQETHTPPPKTNAPSFFKPKQ